MSLKTDGALVKPPRSLTIHAITDECPSIAEGVTLEIPWAAFFSLSDKARFRTVRERMIEAANSLPENCGWSGTFDPQTSANFENAVEQISARYWPLSENAIRGIPDYTPTFWTELIPDRIYRLKADAEWDEVFIHADLCGNVEAPRVGIEHHGDVRGYSSLVFSLPRNGDEEFRACMIEALDAIQMPYVGEEESE